MNGSFGVRGNVRPTAGRPLPARSQVRTAPLLAIGLFLGAVAVVGVIAFLWGL